MAGQTLHCHVQRAGCSPHLDHVKEVSVLEAQGGGQVVLKGAAAPRSANQRQRLALQQKGGQEGRSGAEEVKSGWAGGRIACGRDAKGIAFGRGHSARPEPQTRSERHPPLVPAKQAAACLAI
jgi:hypothetical protein